MFFLSLLTNSYLISFLPSFFFSLKIRCRLGLVVLVKKSTLGKYQWLLYLLLFLLEFICPTDEKFTEEIIIVWFFVFCNYLHITCYFSLDINLDDLFLVFINRLWGMEELGC